MEVTTIWCVADIRAGVKRANKVLHFGKLDVLCLGKPAVHVRIKPARYRHVLLAIRQPAKYVN